AACAPGSAGAGAGAGTAVLMALALFVGGALLARIAARRAVTLRATAFTPAFSRLLSRFVGALEYGEAEVLQADGAGPEQVERRRAALEQLSGALARRYPRSTAWGASLRERFSDLRFTDANRVPFPFRRVVRERFELCSVVTASRGPRLLDLDGSWTI